MADLHWYKLRAVYTESARYACPTRPNKLKIFERPRKLIGDKAYDSDPLDENLALFVTEMIGAR